MEDPGHKFFSTNSPRNLYDKRKSPENLEPTQIGYWVLSHNYAQLSAEPRTKTYIFH